MDRGRRRWLIGRGGIDEETTARQAVLRALLISFATPVALTIVQAASGDASWGRASVLLAIGAAIFPLALLSLWGKVRRDGPRR